MPPTQPEAVLDFIDLNGASSDLESPQRVIIRLGAAHGKPE